MNKVFAENGCKDYVYWWTEDRKTLKKINSLVEDICRNGNESMDKKEKEQQEHHFFLYAQTLHTNRIAKPHPFFYNK